jgi:hypothetical protein
MNNVFGRWIWSSKCFLAAFNFIAITAFLLMKYERHPSSGFGGVSDYYINRLTLI